MAEACGRMRERWPFLNTCAMQCSTPMISKLLVVSSSSALVPLAAQECSLPQLAFTKAPRTPRSISGRVIRDDRQAEAASRVGPVSARKRLHVSTICCTRVEPPPLPLVSLLLLLLLLLPLLLLLLSAPPSLSVLLVCELSMEQMSKGMRHWMHSHSSST
jgi:hypothetical protein